MVTPLAPVVERGRALMQDLQLLGAGAPVRAGLELSKRMGGHAVVFGGLARQGADPSTHRDLRWYDPFPVPDARALAALDPAVRDRTLRVAAAIVDGRIELFGQQLDLGTDPDWHATIDGAGRWPREPWWEIDIRSAARLGDVKWVWELGRHRHLVLLARAAAIEPANAAWRDALNQQLDSWLVANPPETGIHWYSNLEVALRAIAWCEILGLAGAALRPGTRRDMVAALHHSGRHLLADLPYTVSTMRNNHLLGDALGLLVLGAAFRDDDRAARWQRIGERLFTQQLNRQVHPDGAQIEDAVAYHRFVLEMLLTRMRLGANGPDVRRATRTAAEHLARLGVFDGPVPRYGDGDEGRVLVSTGPFDDLVGSTVAALRSAGGEVHVPAAVVPATLDEVAWYALPGARATGDPEASRRAAVAVIPPERAVLVGGGIARARGGSFAVWLKAGGDTSHGHADLCSTVVAWCPEPTSDASPDPGDQLDGDADAGAATRAASTVWLVGDPGTGTYNGAAAERDYFRSTMAHSALRLGGEDELVPYRAFRWRYEPVGAAAEPLVLGESIVLWGWHGAYTRLDPPRRVVRAVILDPSGRDPRDREPSRLRAGARVTVIDWVEGPSGIAWALSLPLGPSVGHDAGVLRTQDPATDFALSLPATPTERRGEEHPFDGWWSSSYGQRVPATRLEVQGTLDGPIVWQLTARATGRAEGPTHDAARADGSTVTVSRNLGLAATFEDDLVRLATPTSQAVLRTDGTVAAR